MVVEAEGPTSAAMMPMTSNSSALPVPNAIIINLRVRHTGGLSSVDEAALKRTY